MQKVAIVHEWLVTRAGAEAVLAEMLALYPQADLFSLIDFMPSDQRRFLGGRKPKTSFLQRLPLARKHYRHYLPLMPLAIEQLDLSGYDLVLSSHYAVAKGVITGPDQLHVSYVHSPMRYAWDLTHQYLAKTGRVSGFLARGVLHYLRQWDTRTIHGVNRYVANSQFIARRIEKTYGKQAQVVYPPVNTQLFRPSGGEKADYYVTASRLVPYKRIDLLVDTFRHLPKRRLIVLGDGPEAARLKAMAPANVEFWGRVPNETLIQTLQQARAFLFAAEEDFGIAPVEAQACGTPVIAYGRGGVLESVRGLEAEVPTGLFFPEQTVDCVKQAVLQFEALSEVPLPGDCRENALRFSPEQFRVGLRQVIEGSKAIPAFLR